MLNCIKTIESCDFTVIALSSDLDNRNRGLWTSLSIHASRNGTVNNIFQFNDHPIFAIPDSCHLLKNLKAAMLKQLIYLPEAYTEHEQLPINVVNACYVKDLEL